MPRRCTTRRPRNGEKIDLALADKWLGHGARASETVTSIIKRARRAAKVAAAE